MSVQTLPRLFRFSSLELVDPAPDLPPEDAIKLYAGTYPQLSVAELSAPFVENGNFVFEICKHEVKTKG